jgi:hypothetical protein
MLYRFKSQAAAEIIFLSAAGEELLSMLGKAASPQGVITLAEMPAAIQILTSAMQTSAAVATPVAADGDPLTDDVAHAPVSLHQRLLPMIDLLQQSLIGRKDVLWGT